jgi:protein-glucosylgalactosylhydroxylysine glucosidase
MTWSALSLLWLDMGDAELSAKYLAQAEQNIMAPFAVWSEVVDPSNPGFDAGILNFITGAGGYIQTIVNGYSGLRYRWGTNGTVMASLKPSLLPQTTSVIWRGIHLAGSTFDVSVSAQSVSVSLTKQGSVPLQYQISNGPLSLFTTSPILTSVGTPVTLLANPF